MNLLSAQELSRKVGLPFQRDKRSSDAVVNSMIFCCQVVPYGQNGRRVDRDSLHGPYGYFFFACARAEPAADLDAELVRPSLRTAEAAVAAFAEVTFDGATCASELPAALFDALPVDPLERTVDDLVATLGLVTFVAIARPPKLLDTHTVSADPAHCNDMHPVEVRLKGS